MGIGFPKTKSIGKKANNIIKLISL